MENNVIQNILMEFEKTRDSNSEFFRVQNELSQTESELVALKIRFEYKVKENANLMSELNSKNKLLNENKFEIESKNERLKSLEFHYKELIQKHKLCLECMTQQRVELESLKSQYEKLNNENDKMSDHKSQLRGLFKEQIEDWDSSLKKLMNENEDNVRTIRELRKNGEQAEAKYEHSAELNLKLKERVSELEKELISAREELDQSVEEKSARANLSEENIRGLELELTKLNSRLDQAFLELNESRSNLVTQTKLAQQKTAQYNELKLSFEKLYVENQSLIKNNSHLNDELNLNVKMFNDKFEMASKTSNQERNLLKRQQIIFESVIKKLAHLYNEQQKKLDSLLALFKNQSNVIKVLRTKTREAFKKLAGFKVNEKNSREKLKSLGEKCEQLEIKYSLKSEEFNSIEREFFVTKNSLEVAMNDLGNYQKNEKIKEDEICAKNRTITQLEVIVSQQNMELNRRKSEINERISEIELLDKHIKEERVSLDSKHGQLEASLKLKSKQLQQRIDQIKELTDILTVLKEEKDEADFKLSHFENLIKCQKLEIESKSSMLKQFELRIQDLNNETNGLKSKLAEAQIQTKPGFKLNRNLECKETQTEMEFNFEEKKEIKNNNNCNEELDDLKITLRVREKLIETVNDSLVLKDAEIARLKARIGTFERQKINQNV